jgi:hypothetical protein
MSYESDRFKIEGLARLFSNYKIYPQSCYKESSPVDVLNRMFPDDHYSRDLKVFLPLQEYAPEQRGADLPWWGKKFFTQEKGFRTLIVAQDSLAKDARSIVLYAHLMPLVSDKAGYERYTTQLHSNGRSFFNSWNTVKEQLHEWDIGLDFLYITDAKKVYTKGSWKDWDFDVPQSKKLLEEEIDFCNPDLIILLGASPLRLLDKEMHYSSAVNKRDTMLIRGRRCVVSPFFIGQGRTQAGFKEKVQITGNAIRAARDASF